MLYPKKFISDTLKIALSSGQGRKPRDCGGAFRGSERAAATPQRASQVALVVKNPPANAGDVIDTGSVPRLGRSPGGANGNPLQYPCLENPTDRGAWQDAVHGVRKSRTQLKQLSKHAEDTGFKRTTMPSTWRSGCHYPSQPSSQP